MRRLSRLFENAKNSGITDSIIFICVVMLIVGTVIPAVQNALLFYPPLALIEPWRFITSAFLHAGFWHFAFNMINLYVLGIELERYIGKWRFILLYLFSAFMGNLGVYGWALLTSAWHVGVLGASGAVFGLLGAWLAFSGIGTDNFKSILVLAGINLVYSLINSGISWQSHLAGFIGGYVLAWIWKQLWKRKTRRHSYN